MAIGGGGVGGTPVNPSQLSTEDWIFLAQNADQLAVVMAQYKAAQATLDARIAIVGDADQIVSLKASAKDAAAAAAADRAAAAQELVDAQDNAGHVRQAAKDEAANIVSQAKSDAQQILGTANAAGIAANEKAIKLTDRETAVKARETAVTQRETDAAQAQSDAEAALAAANNYAAGVRAALASVPPPVAS